jgi:hypothetical protein
MQRARPAGCGTARGLDFTIIDDATATAEAEPHAQLVHRAEQLSADHQAAEMRRRRKCCAMRRWTRAV